MIVCGKYLDIQKERIKLIVDVIEDLENLRDYQRKYARTGYFLIEDLTPAEYYLLVQKGF